MLYEAQEHIFIILKLLNAPLICVITCFRSCCLVVKKTLRESRTLFELKQKRKTTIELTVLTVDIF